MKGPSRVNPKTLFLESFISWVIKNEANYEYINIPILLRIAAKLFVMNELKQIKIKIIRNFLRRNRKKLKNIWIILRIIITK